MSDVREELLRDAWIVYKKFYSFLLSIHEYLDSSTPEQPFPR